MLSWNKGKVIKELKKKAKKLKHSPSRSEIPMNLYGASRHYFGSLNKAKKAAGLKIEKLKYNPIKKSAYKPSKDFAYVLGVIYG
ncbi:MAG: hypothetical protein AABX72_03195, partial [Nanoarchaeota archaeon]